MAIKRCMETFVAMMDGGFHTVVLGELVDDSDPIYRAHRDLFEDLSVATVRKGPVQATVEQATAGPGEKRMVSPPPKPIRK